MAQMTQNDQKLPKFGDFTQEVGSMIKNRHFSVIYLKPEQKQQKFKIIAELCQQKEPAEVFIFKFPLYLTAC